MALDILHDSWGPYTHTEVENALKAYLAVLEGRINQAIQEGGIGLTDLSLEVQALLTKANTALQPENIAAWAKAPSKPGYTADEITGVEGFQNLLAKLQDMDAKIQAAAQSGSDITQQDIDDAVAAAVAALVDSAPGTLDTLKELAAALGNDANFAATIAAQLATKISGIKANGASDTLPVDQNGVVELPASSTGNADNGIEDISASGGVIVITISSGDTYTLDLNHTHSGYASLSALAAKQDVLYDSTTVSSAGTPNFKTLNGKSLLGAGNLSLSDLGAMPANATVVKAISVNGTDVQLDANGKAAITVSGGGGGISDVTYNGSSVVSNGVAVLDSVIPDVSGKANVSELSFTDGTGADAGKTTIQLKSGLSRQVLTAHQSLAGRVQSSQVTSIVVLASQSDYDLIQNPDSNTLYLIKESNA